MAVVVVVEVVVGGAAGVVDVEASAAFVVGAAAAVELDVELGVGVVVVVVDVDVDVVLGVLGVVARLVVVSLTSAIACVTASRTASESGSVPLAERRRRRPNECTPLKHRICGMGFSQYH